MSTDDDEELVATLVEEEELHAWLEPDEVLFAMISEDELLVAQLAEEQGMRGPPGPTGLKGERGVTGRDGAAGGALSRSAAAPLAGGRAVISVDAQYVRAVDGTDPDDADRILGVCMQSAASAGEDVEVVRLGLVSDASWDFEPGHPVFSGVHGELVHVPPVGMAFWARLGVAVERTAVFVDLQPPIYL